ncbi:MAG: type II toxin-antitoxin system RelE/ParE family toxin [Ignavibacteria bacterium]|nr:type II toxin-antitoxin system RelE/ParE family toxin [Ignavibacteria bacterium]
MKSIDSKAVKKILYNIDLAEQTNDPRLFKKLNKNIWEFRSKYGNLHYRLLAFWDKSGKTDTLVIAAHGIIKKTSKISVKEIEKAEKIRAVYFSNIK